MREGSGRWRSKRVGRLGRPSALLEAGAAGDSSIASMGSPCQPDALPSGGPPSGQETHASSTGAWLPGAASAFGFVSGPTGNKARKVSTSWRLLPNCARRWGMSQPSSLSARPQANRCVPENARPWLLSWLSREGRVQAAAQLRSARSPGFSRPRAASARTRSSTLRSSTPSACKNRPRSAASGAGVPREAHTCSHRRSSPMASLFGFGVPVGCMTLVSERKWIAQVRA